MIYQQFEMTKRLITLRHDIFIQVHYIKPSILKINKNPYFELIFLIVSKKFSFVNLEIDFLNNFNSVLKNIIYNITYKIPIVFFGPLVTGKHGS